MISFYDICLKENFSEESVKNFLSAIQTLVDSFDTLNTVGFINFTDLDRLPVIKDLYKNIFNKDAEGLKKTDFFSELDNTPKNYAVILKWCFNLFILHALLFTVQITAMYKSVHATSEESTPYLNSERASDLLEELQNLEKELSCLLDNSIRVKLRQQGVSISQNIYCGFDTEYQNIDSTRNELLSVQLALSIQTSLKIPVNEPYTFSVVNSHTGEISPDLNIHSAGIDLNYILEKINNGIKIYRSVKYLDYDKGLELLEKGLTGEETGFIKEEFHTTFLFSHTPVKTYFLRTGKYSLQELVKTVKFLMQEDLTTSLENVYSKMKKVYESGGLTSLPDSENERQSEAEGEGDSKINLEKLPRIISLPRIEVEAEAADLADGEESLSKTISGRRRT